MDMQYLAAAASVALTLASIVPYVRDMLRGTTRPNIVSWGLWCLIQCVFAAAQLRAGASLSIVLPLAEVCTVGVVVALGVAGYGYRKYGPFDIVCLLLALGAIALWQITNDPVVALWMSVAADCIAAVPTLVKSYRDPRSETPLAYVLVILSAIAAGFAATHIDLPNLLWPAYIAVINSATVALILLGRRRRA